MVTYLPIGKCFNAKLGKAKANTFRERFIKCAIFHPEKTHRRVKDFYTAGLQDWILSSKKYVVICLYWNRNWKFQTSQTGDQSYIVLRLILSTFHLVCLEFIGREITLVLHNRSSCLQGSHEGNLD